MLIENLDYELISGDDFNPYGREYRLLRDYKFFFRTHEITIPAGYMWDGPSGVPYVGTLNKGWLAPSVVHDYLYEEQGRIDGVEYTREEVDEKFYKDLRYNHVSFVYILVMKIFLDEVFEYVWNDTQAGSTKVLKRYMVPVSYALFAAGFLLTTGIVWQIPTVLGILAALL